MNLKMFHFFTLRKSKRGRRSNDITVLNFLRAFHQTLGTHKWSIILVKKIDEHSLLQKQINVCKNHNQPKKVHVFFFSFKIQDNSSKMKSVFIDTFNKFEGIRTFCGTNCQFSTQLIKSTTKYKICYCICFVIYVCYKNRDNRYANKKTVMIYLLPLILPLVVCTPLLLDKKNFTTKQKKIK